MRSVFILSRLRVHTMLVIPLGIIMTALSVGGGLRHDVEKYSTISVQHQNGKEWNPKWTVTSFSKALWKAQRALCDNNNSHKKLHGSVFWTRLKNEGKTITVYPNGSSSFSSKSKQRKSFNIEYFCSSLPVSTKNFMTW